MLKIIVPGTELFDEANETFITVEPSVLELEHSLVSLSKWESKFRKPFLEAGSKSTEEINAYVEAMVLNTDHSPNVFKLLNKAHYDMINDYISSEESATTFTEPKSQKGRRGGEVITSELIYFWMVSYQIPFECETWHLNRLFNLIRICNVKNSKQKKMSRSEIATRNRELNEQRKAQLGTSG